MFTLELVLRVATVTELGILGLAMLTQAANNSAYRYGAVLLLCISGYLLAPLVYRQWNWGLASYPVIMLATLAPAAFWYFTGSVFNDKFNPPLYFFLLALAAASLSIVVFHGQASPDSKGVLPASAWPGWLAQAAKLLWLAAAFITVLRDWRVDLVEPRRRFRRLIVMVGGAYMGVIMAVELFITGAPPAALEMLNASIIFIAISALCGNLLSLKSSNIFAAIFPDPKATTAETPPDASLLAAQVLALMKQERAYAAEGLTINSLAQQLRAQPYQLRQVINGELGHRNFNAFINLYRVKEIAERLAREEFRDTPLLTLALDAGFRSLAPFNRSFKDHFGVTPSDYKQDVSPSS